MTNRKKIFYGFYQFIVTGKFGYGERCPTRYFNLGKKDYFQHGEPEMSGYCSNRGS